MPTLLETPSPWMNFWQIVLAEAARLDAIEHHDTPKGDQ